MLPEHIYMCGCYKKKKEKKWSVETDLEMTQVLKLTEKDFKIAPVSVFCV